jgi:hypothetical protein
MGATEALSPISRILVMGLMFLGRLGPLTVAAALARDDPAGDWRYPQERSRSVEHCAAGYQAVGVLTSPRFGTIL